MKLLIGNHLDQKKSVRAKKLESSIVEIRLGQGESKSPQHQCMV